MKAKIKSLGSSLVITLTIFAFGLVLGSFLGKTLSKPVPLSDCRIERDAYELVYDGQHKQAKWVYEHLTSENIQGDSNRANFDFQEDPAIPAILRATKDDYKGSGLDRGHLCPAADARFSNKAMKETFYLSNISPQCPNLNRGYWLKLERYVRELAMKHGSIHVFTGGLYLPKLEADGKRYVRYQVIGENDVAVPTHFFKIVLDDAHRKIEAFIIPNEPVAGDIPLESFMATVEKIEKASGIVFQSFQY